jgi:hypothetical protein
MNDRKFWDSQSVSFRLYLRLTALVIPSPRGHQLHITTTTALPDMIMALSRSGICHNFFFSSYLSFKTLRFFVVISEI